MSVFHAYFALVTSWKTKNSKPQIPMGAAHASYSFQINMIYTWIILNTCFWVLLKAAIKTSGYFYNSHFSLNCKMSVWKMETLCFSINNHCCCCLIDLLCKCLWKETSLLYIVEVKEPIRKKTRNKKKRGQRESHWRKAERPLSCDYHLFWKIKPQLLSTWLDVGAHSWTSAAGTTDHEKHWRQAITNQHAVWVNKLRPLWE